MSVGAAAVAKKRSVAKKVHNTAPTLLRAVLWSCGILAACSNTPVDRGDPPLLVPQERWRFVSSDSTVGSSLTNISGMAVLPDGSVYTTHSKESLVRRFDSTGKLVDTFGRVGQGPGEFIKVGAVSYVGDTLLVFDDIRWRVGMFNANGEFIREGILPSGPAFMKAFQVLSPEILLYSEYFYVPEAGIRMRLDSSRVSLADFRGNVLRQLAVPGPTQRVQTLLGGEDDMLIVAAFSGVSKIEAAPNGTGAIMLQTSNLWGGRPGELRMLKIDPSGQVSETTLHVPLVRVSAGWVDSLATAISRRFPDRTAEVRALLDAKEYLPEFESFYYGDAETIWLRGSGNGRTRFLVSTDGELLGRIDLPMGFTFRHGSRSRMWGNMRDESGLPIIVAFDLVPVAK